MGIHLARQGVLGGNRERAWSWATARAGQGKAVVEIRGSRVKNLTGHGAGTVSTSYQPSLQVGMPQAFTFVSLHEEGHSNTL